MRRHVSAEVLALLREGEVRARKAGRITAHLSACPECAGIDSDLAAVPAMLAAVPLPPMPDTIAERLQVAIASEATARAATGAASGAAPGAAPDVNLTDAGASGLAASGADAGPGDGPGADAGEPLPTPGRPDLPERTRRSSRRFRMPGWSSPLVLRGLAAAGAVIVIAGAGFLFVHGQTTGQGSAGTGSGHGPLREARPAPSARVTGSGARAGYAGVNGPFSLNYRLKGKIATARALTTHHNYTKLNLGPMVRKDVASVASIGKGVTPTSRPRRPRRPRSAGSAFRRSSGA